MYSYFFHTWPIPHVIVSSLGFASFAGALSTMFWLAQSFADNGGDPAWSHDLHVRQGPGNEDIIPYFGP